MGSCALMQRCRRRLRERWRAHRRRGLRAYSVGAGQNSAAQNIQKNPCWTTVAEPIWGTLAELPFTGDQVVCLGHNQAAVGHTMRTQPVNCFNGLLYNLGLPKIKIVCQQIRG